ncbi:MAG TPA: glycosyltransferase family 4 protein [Thermoanaerobaculia bacterium]|nr:glycosyltransferase family 4 protein [Thermoanaerobaculia bacterium]
MRILALSNCPLDEKLGSGYVALRYARGLRARGHLVDLLGPADYEPLHGLRRGIRYRQTLGMAATSLGRLARSEYDVLEYYGGEAWLAVSALARLPGRRFLLVCHSNGLETHYAEVAREAAGASWHRPWYQADHGALFARAFRDCDALVTVARYDRDYALREGYATADRVLAIENPLPDTFLGLDPDFARQPVIGYCGAWLPNKGAALIERDLPPLLRRFPAWRLTLVGVGPGFRSAEHFPPDVLPRITVIPHAERETELRGLYQGFAISILPSIYESFGLSAAEAMACGCALVASPVGFAASLRHGEEAFLLGDRASPGLCEALRTVIEDAALRQRLARGGYLRVQSLRWDGAVARLEAAYQTWLADFRDGNEGP